jgi:hypothetical protein
MVSGSTSGGQRSRRGSSAGSLVPAHSGDDLDEQWHDARPSHDRGLSGVRRLSPLVAQVLGQRVMSIRGGLHCTYLDGCVVSQVRVQADDAFGKWTLTIRKSSPCALDGHSNRRPAHSQVATAASTSLTPSCQVKLDVTGSAPKRRLSLRRPRDFCAAYWHSGCSR